MVYSDPQTTPSRLYSQEEPLTCVLCSASPLTGQGVCRANGSNLCRVHAVPQIPEFPAQMASTQFQGLCGASMGWSSGSSWAIGWWSWASGPRNPQHLTWDWTHEGEKAGHPLSCLVTALPTVAWHLSASELPRAEETPLSVWSPQALPEAQCTSYPDACFSNWRSTKLVSLPHPPKAVFLWAPLQSCLTSEVSSVGT